MTTTEAAHILKENDNFLIITHARPDGDALGCAGALCSALKRLGKHAQVFKNPEITESFSDLVSGFFDGELLREPFVISVDTASENMFSLGFSGAVQLCIDHHESNSFYAEHTLLDAKKSACGEIVMQLIEELCGNLTAREAELLYVAVSTDTGCFCYANTNADTLRCAAHLIDCGVPNGRINKQYFRSFSYSRLRLESMIYAQMKSHAENRINIATVTLSMMADASATEDDCDDLASLPAKVRGSVVSILVREISPGRSKASVRTNETVNANNICAKFGGGGHAMAAGCTAELAPFDFAQALLAAAQTEAAF